MLDYEEYYPVLPNPLFLNSRFSPRKVKGEDGLPLAASDEEEDEEAGDRERRAMLNYEEYYPVLLPLRRPADEGPEDEPADDKADAAADADWAQIAVRGPGIAPILTRADARIACAVRCIMTAWAQVAVGVASIGLISLLRAPAHVMRGMAAGSGTCCGGTAAAATSSAWRYRSSCPAAHILTRIHMCMCMREVRQLRAGRSVLPRQSAARPRRSWACGGRRARRASAAWRCCKLPTQSQG